MEPIWIGGLLPGGLYPTPKPPAACAIESPEAPFSEAWSDEVPRQHYVNHRRLAKRMQLGHERRGYPTTSACSATVNFDQPVIGQKALGPEIRVGTWDHRLHLAVSAGRFSLASSLVAQQQCLGGVGLWVPMASERQHGAGFVKNVDVAAAQVDCTPTVWWPLFL